MSPVGEAHVGVGTGGEELSGPTSHGMAMGQQWWGLVKINRNWRNILHLCIFKAGAAVSQLCHQLMGMLGQTPARVSSLDPGRHNAGV